MRGVISAFLMLVVAILAVLFLGAIWYAYKNVQIWSSSMSGQAVLAEAEFSRQVRIKEASAKKEAAELEGQAELTKAQYAARANHELAQGLGGSEGYLRYLYIRMLEEQGGEGRQVIYIPTEAGMPVLEAGRIGAAR